MCPNQNRPCQVLSVDPPVDDEAPGIEIQVDGHAGPRSTLLEHLLGSATAPTPASGVAQRLASTPREAPRLPVDDALANMSPANRVAASWRWNDAARA